MREKIYEIPLNDAFDEDGCPFCRLHAMLERSEVERVLGPAMMEPDVRIETNKKGFCPRHVGELLQRQKALQTALLFESLLDTLLSEPHTAKNLGARAHSCYLCERVDKFFTDMLDTYFYMCRALPAFREKALRGGFCMPHYIALMEYAKTALPRREAKAFSQSLEAAQKEYAGKIKGDISAFARSFHYDESSAAPNENAVGDAAALLAGDGACKRRSE